MVRVAADQNIASWRHFVDRRLPEEDMGICGVETELWRPTITETQREPISIGVRDAGSTKLIADWRRIESQSPLATIA